jgi:hypothetical protein
MSPTRTAALLLLAAAVPVFAGAAGPAPPEGTEAPPATASAELVRIDHRIVVSASRERVWEALTTPEGLARWIAPRSNVRLEIGGPYELYFRPDDPVDRGRRTVVMVTHNLTEGLQLATRVAIQVAGRIAWMGAASEVEGEGFEAFYHDVVEGRS